MKKIISVLCFLAIAAYVIAQVLVSPMLSTTNGTAIDTITNTGARSQVLAVPGQNALITIVATVTEISGTTAGNVKVYGSLDGTSYALADSANTWYPVDQAAAQSRQWSLAPSKFQYYKVTYTGAGTMSAKLSSKLRKSKY